MAEEEEDPIVQALPPATDYLTYLTLLEYQLTPSRLPILHKVLQNEVLTTNIGWDLVQLLLPMLPESQECLHDVARFGNPREVILRVSDALNGLQPEEGEDEYEGTKKDDLEPKVESTLGSGSKQHLPRHIMQFNCLLAMLSVLHSRIKTKYPSRFITTSLQAALEAYTLMPTNETTAALLEFFRDLSPLKRPALPPRGTSESSVVRLSEVSAPDPEAETSSLPSSSYDQEISKKLLQFGLIELLKSYLLSLTNSTDSGVDWTPRLLEKLQPQLHIPSIPSKTDMYAAATSLKERDMIVGKITALSRDFGIDENDLLRIASLPADQQLSLLDFDELPKSVDDILLERHGSLLLLAARLVMTVLFSEQNTLQITVFPELADIFSNFIGSRRSTDGVSLEQPQILLDSLLALVVISIQKPIERAENDQQYEDFVLTLTACCCRQAYNRIRRIPATIVHSHPSPLARFKLIQNALAKSELLYAKESAIGWLKDEILTEKARETNGADAVAADSVAENDIFTDPHYFSVLSPLLFNPSDISLNTSSGIVSSWLKFTQSLFPSIHAALSLYYILISSESLRKRLKLEDSYPDFCSKFLTPLKSLCHEFECGQGQIEAAVGEEMCGIGMARSIGLISHLITRLEDAFEYLMMANRQRRYNGEH
jgi:hypothetical protein